MFIHYRRGLTAVKLVTLQCVRKYLSLYFIIPEGARFVFASPPQSLDRLWGSPSFLYSW
jgi:hypothetical protein